MNIPHSSRLHGLWRTARSAVAALGVIGPLLGGTLPAQAADGVLAGAAPMQGVTQLTLPSPIWLPGALGGHLWIADNGLTFCRWDPSPSGMLAVNPSTCNTTAKSPAQAVLDPRPILDPFGKDTGKRYVYIADNSTSSPGAVRVTFDQSTETIVPGSGIVLGDGGTAGRTNSIALNPADGKLYIGHVKGGSILRIANPDQDVALQWTEIVGRTTDGRGVRGGMAFVCGAKAGTCDLYTGEVGGNGVSIIPDAQGCNPFGTGGCQAMVTAITTNSPGGLTSDGHQYVFVGDSPLSGVGTVLRYNVDTDTQDVVSASVPSYPATYPVAHPQTTFTGITGIAIDPNGNVFVGDDPTVGAALPPPVGQGKLWKIAGTYQSMTPCGTGVTTGCIDMLGSPGIPAQVTPPQSLAAPAALKAWGPTAPHGVVWIPGALGGHYWVADHTQGLCRLDPAPDDPGLSATNPYTCDPQGATGSPGQPVYDPTGNFVFVPDSAVKSPGLWRLNFDPNGTVCKNPDGTFTGPETICNPVVVAPGAGLANDKLVGVAMGSDGNIYAAGLKNGFVYRVKNPRGDPAAMAVEIVGITSDNRGINGSLGLLGNDLYLPENKGLTVIKNVTGCALPVPNSTSNNLPCTAQRLNLPYVPFALSVAADNSHGAVYVAVASGAANGTIYRLTPSTGVSVAYATQGCVFAQGCPAAPGTTGFPNGYVEDCSTMCERRLDAGIPPSGLLGFHFPLGMYVDGSGNLLLGDDIMAGSRGFHGHVWQVGYTP